MFKKDFKILKFYKESFWISYWLIYDIYLKYLKKERVNVLKKLNNYNLKLVIKIYINYKKIGC